MRGVQPDLRVRSQATGLGTYVDVAVICGELELDPEDPERHTALDPWVIVEVLSPSTEEYDRGAKLEHYFTIPSLREVLLVVHEKREVEALRREADGTWSRRVVAGEGAVEVDALGVSLPLPDVYRDPRR